MEPEASAVIFGVELTVDNYAVAISMLKDWRGDDHIGKEPHYHRLTSLPSSSQELIKLRSIIAENELHFRTLEALGEDTSE